MSRAMLKEALDLFELEEQESKNSCRPTSNDLKGSKRGKREFTTTIDDKVKNKLSKVELRKERLKSQGKLKNTVQDLNLKCILDEVRREKNVDHSKRNLQMLQYVTSVTATSVGSAEVDKILTHNKGRMAKNQQREMKNTSKDENKSVFTDADFEEFEKTYFCKS